MPKAQDAATWTNPPLFKRPSGVEGALVSTLAGRRDGSRPADPAPDPEPEPQGVIFQESFDDQPDWTSTMYTTESTQTASGGDTLPVGWGAIYQSTEWSPETGHPDNHASLEILSANSDKTRSGSGKSAVFWRESWNDPELAEQWFSDSQLVRLLDKEYSAIYVEFYMTFSANRWERENFGSNFESKLFRAMHWSGTGNYFNGSDGQINPRLIWQCKRDDYGMRSVLNRHRGPLDGNGKFSESLNYTSHTLGMAPGGTDPLLTDHVNGGYLKDFGGSNTSLTQVFGPAGTWKKVGIWLKLNSAPGVADGENKMWLDDQRFYSKTDAIWVVDDGTGRMPGWNLIAIGGNSYFEPYPATDKYEDWWAMDDLEVADTLPEGLE